MSKRYLPEKIENYRDRSWARDPELRVEDVSAAERLVDRVGFCSALTDSRRPGPSLYIAVCGRRDAQTPRNMHKDPETSLTWTIKDELIRRGRVFYGKLRGPRTILITPRLLPHFNVLFGVVEEKERSLLSKPAQRIIAILRKEWELSTGELRQESGITERKRFNSAMDEVQKNLKLIPSDVVYVPKFTYIWTLTESRFRDELAVMISREEALKEIARAYLLAAGLTWRGELARVTGLSNPDAGIGNWALVDEGFAIRVAPGVYRLKELEL